MKTIWITSIDGGREPMTATAAALKRYGLQAQGHEWIDEPDKAVARMAADAFTKACPDAWLILSSPAAMAKASTRYGVSLLSIGIANGAGNDAPPPVFWLALPASADPANPAPAASVPPATPSLPPLLAAAPCYAIADASWPAKLVAAVSRARAPREALPGGYRIALWGDERIGQWLEIGSLQEPLKGFVLGVTGTGGKESASITFQAVGPRGGLPERSTLEFAQQGLRIVAGGRDFDCWSLRNRIGTGESYYVQIKGCPAALLLMPYPDQDDADASIIAMQ